MEDESSLSVSDGFNLTMRRQGTGFPCIMLHGFADGAYVWRDLSDELSMRCRAVSIDLRGHGNSDWDACGRYSLNDYVADIVTVLDTPEVNPAILIGHSMGARIALEATRRRPSAVAALVLVDYSPTLSPSVSRRFRSDIEGLRARFNSPAEYAKILQSHRPFLSSEEARRIAAESLKREDDGSFKPKTDPRIATRLGGAGSSDMDQQLDLHDILCRTLLVRGEWSAVLSDQMAKSIATGLLDSEIVTIPAAGHAVMLDNPKEFVRVVSRFVYAAIPAIHI